MKWAALTKPITFLGLFMTIPGDSRCFLKWVIGSSPDGMPPMTVADMPIAEIRATHRETGDGLHLVARNYKKGVRLDTHMHREAQLVYAAKGTMQVTTPKGRWLVPPDRAVWVPALLAHAIDVLADIQMRTLYFELDWLKREARRPSLDAEFVVRVSPLLHQTILALFDDRGDRERTELLLRLT